MSPPDHPHEGGILSRTRAGEAGDELLEVLADAAARACMTWTKSSHATTLDELRALVRVALAPLVAGMADAAASAGAADRELADVAMRDERDARDQLERLQLHVAEVEATRDRLVDYLAKRDVDLVHALEARDALATRHHRTEATLARSTDAFLAAADLIRSLRETRTP